MAHDESPGMTMWEGVWSPDGKRSFFTMSGAFALSIEPASTGEWYLNLSGAGAKFVKRLGIFPTREEAQRAAPECFKRWLEEQVRIAERCMAALVANGHQTFGLQGRG